jgi:seryl-tRNA synthetase
VTAQREASDVFDIRWIRENPQAFDAGLGKRGIEPGGEVKFSAELVALDEARRAVITRLQQAQSLRKGRSNVFAKAKAKNDEASLKVLSVELAESKAEIEKLEAEQREIDDRLRRVLSVIPNLPAEDVPVGADEKANKEIRRVGEPPKLAGANKPKEHFEIGEALGLMDFETAAKLSGARFVVLKGALARMERALAQFMLDLHTAPEKDGRGGYTEIVPPYLVRDDVMYGTAQLPKFEHDQFDQIPQSVARSKEVARKYLNDFCTDMSLSLFAQWGKAVSAEALAAEMTKFKEQFERNYDTWGAIEEFLVEGRRWLIPTAEVPLTNLVRESIRSEDELPMRVTAYTPCFRAEAGAAGKDTRGMIRQHQFSKVELVSITTPEESAAEHERMTACAEEVLKRLGLAYRVVLLCTGDMGFAAGKTYDLEVWLPGQDTYREISSCSNCGDFQARRMDARFRRGGGKPEYVHTLNGSGLAVGRTLIAILENYQQADGSVAIPDALVPYMGGCKRIEKA